MVVQGAANGVERKLGLLLMRRAIKVRALGSAAVHVLSTSDGRTELRVARLSACIIQRKFILLVLLHLARDQP